MTYNEEFKTFCKSLGKNIKSLREKRGIAIEEMAKITGIRKEYLKKIENGKAYGMRLVKHLAKIASALNLKLHELF